MNALHYFLDLSESVIALRNDYSKYLDPVKLEDIDLIKFIISKSIEYQWSDQAEKQQN